VVVEPNSRNFKPRGTPWARATRGGLPLGKNLLRNARLSLQPSSDGHGSPATVRSIIIVMLMWFRSSARRLIDRGGVVIRHMVTMTGNGKLATVVMVLRMLDRSMTLSPAVAARYCRSGNANSP